MVVDEYVGRCLDVGSTPTSSIKTYRKLSQLTKTLLNQGFFFWSCTCITISLAKRETQFTPSFRVSGSIENDKEDVKQDFLNFHNLIPHPKYDIIEAIYMEN